MRYTLRNKDKIKEEFSDVFLDRMLRSLDVYFDKNDKPEEFECDPHPYILIDDMDHSVNIFAFYVIKITFGAYLLAFKEVIG